MKLLKLKLVAKKVWLWAKKFWWAIVLGLLFIVVALVGALTRNGAFLASLLDLIDAKREAHDEEMGTLARVHDAEVAAKNKRLKEHQKRMAELEEDFATRGETLDKQKEAELKRIVDESYNDPEKLAREIAEAFGLKNG
jgi:flagellar biosynthesis/type III secretory pathway M-ring protein FliF/YscJ